MMTSKAFMTFLMPFVLAAPLAMAETSFSVKTWEESLKTSLQKGKTNLDSHFDFKSIEKKSLKKTTSQDRKNMAAARKAYEQGKFDTAIKKYDLVEKGSDYWLEAVEEKAWAFHLKNEFEKSLAQTKTLLAEPLVQVVGSEPFFLQSLGQLKICDYPGVFATHQIFKDSQRARVASIEALAKTGTTSHLDALVSKAESFPLTFTQVGVEAKDLPRLFFRDLEFQKQLLQAKLTDRGAALIQEQMNSSDKKNAKLEKTLAGLKKTNASALNKMANRLQALAKHEDERNQLMLQKLGLIEIETIQRMHADQGVDQDTFASSDFRKVTTDDLVFPDDGKPWIDELDKYEVSANKCPRNVRRKM